MKPLCTGCRERIYRGTSRPSTVALRKLHGVPDPGSRVSEFPQRQVTETSVHIVFPPNERVVVPSRLHLILIHSFDQLQYGSCEYQPCPAAFLNLKFQ